ncbi:hypothetical protein TTHERM_00621020 (macronuclear) [Tetrahymena thermophila SB210]|uniref:Uncharacterized protein n=1 Tax=Tetrahymena thermophila (strain SB210) TaxID=312017 RepID=Q23MF7_TETTS|nr:hypothetical protein TTHERM_00621020 [Tetrahymena thermophila SB210]EAR97682.1 hypothetical protein TTHERM_00621020 [Tetrahymena thermophila SB210]|eukprot:XP_001017927.1 hypothetical protein TTHERM_00621020 [Tetrahymena thermophila SB210]
MSTLQADVEFYFVKSHFKQEKDICREAGLNASNEIVNYIKLLKLHLSKKDIEILPKTDQYKSQGAFGNKCSVTEQRIRFPRQLRNNIETILITIVQEANLYTVTSKDVTKIVVVKNISEDQDILENQQNQNQQAQIVQNRPNSDAVLYQPMNQIHKNNSLEFNGQQILRNQNNVQQINNPQMQFQILQDSQQIQVQQTQMNKIIINQNCETRTSQENDFPASSNNREIQRLKEELEKSKNEKDYMAKEHERKIKQKDDVIQDQQQTISVLQYRLNQKERDLEADKNDFLKKYEDLFERYSKFKKQIQIQLKHK